MPTIDADAHVVESDRTWSYMDAKEQEYRPRIVHPEGSPTAWWFVDGKLRGLARTVLTAESFKEMSERAGRVMDTPEETREAENVQARLKHMDELGVDVQVLYPTMFIEEVAEKPEIDTALCKSYNRWLADIWAEGKGRLRWACVLPLMCMDEALNQLDFARENGACAIYMRSIEQNGRLLHDPYFYPIYERAQEMNMPIGVHIANGNPEMIDLLTQRTPGGATFWKFRLASVGAFHSVLMSGLMERFPKLRMGFLEASAQWLPYVLKDAKRRFAIQGRVFPEKPLEEWRLWISCQTDDDVSYLLSYSGEDQLVIGTDYGHNDQSTELEALRNLERSGGLDPKTYHKITYENPKTLYAL